jgi:hypothetical protein
MSGGNIGFEQTRARYNHAHASARCRAFELT